MRAWAALGSACAMLTACVDKPSLFESSGGGSGIGKVRVSLGAELPDVYGGDTITILSRGSAQGSRVQVLLVDSARGVLWRSAAVEARRDTAWVAFEGLPAGLAGGAGVLVTAVVADRNGDRFYASDDTTAVTSLAGAATRTVRIFAGRRVRTPGMGIASDLVPAPDRGVAYFTVPGSGSVGTLVLGGNARWSGSTPVGASPERLAYRRGILAVLGGGGGELSWLRTGDSGLELLGRGLLPAQELELDSTFLGAVRPTGRALVLGCRDDGCADVVAFIPSGVQALDGSIGAGSGETGVLRVVAMSSDVGAGARVVLPGYSASVLGDSTTIASVFAPQVPDGGRVLRQRRGDASRCVSASLGGSLVAAGPDGAVFVAGASGQASCGAGTRVLRVDLAGSERPRISDLAIRNARAEERVGAATDLQISEDGRGLLVMTADGVIVLDPFLRVRGTLRVPGVRAVAWLRGASDLRFAVADSTGATLFDGDRLTPVARVPLGAAMGRIAYVRLQSGEEVLVATIHDGFVVASSPVR